jgi:hypothetical protein
MGVQHIDHGLAHRLVVVRDDHADRAHAPNAETPAGAHREQSEVTLTKVLLSAAGRMRSQFQDQ